MLRIFDSLFILVHCCCCWWMRNHTQTHTNRPRKNAPFEMIWRSCLSSSISFWLLGRAVGRSGVLSLSLIIIVNYCCCWALGIDRRNMLFKCNNSVMIMLMVVFIYTFIFFFSFDFRQDSCILLHILLGVIWFLCWIIGCVLDNTWFA